MKNLTSIVSALRVFRRELARSPRPVAADRDASSRKLMRAAVYREYGPPEVLRVEEFEKPVPAPDEVLVQVVASTVCTADWRGRKPDPAVLAWVMNGFPRPKRINILGMELAGTVDSIGKDVMRFEVGDRVFGFTGFRFGAHAEYARVPEDYLARMPINASFAEAAAIPYGGTALGFLRAAGIRAGQEVLIHGASGSVGSAAVQIAKHFGARVTAVSSTANLGLVKSLGADEVIDYTKDDFSKAGRIYDVIHDTVDKSGFWRSMRALKRGGVYVMVGPGVIPVFGGLWTKLTGAGQVIGIMPRFGIAELEFLRDLVEQGEFRPFIDRRYPLADIAEAHRYAEAGHKKGNVVIEIAPRE